MLMKNDNSNGNANSNVDEIQITSILIRLSIQSTLNKEYLIVSNNLQECSTDKKYQRRKENNFEAKI